MTSTLPRHHRTRYAPRMPGFVSYLRVSTARQGASGLGLEAQRHAVAARLADNDDLIAEFIEVESGKRGDRPELTRALTECRVRKATLIVAKVDRLTRNLSFLLTLLDAGVEPIFCDLPTMEGPIGRFMLTQMAAVAELEAGLISKRTKEALAAAKARGVTLGGYRGGSADYSAQGKLSGAIRAANAQARAHDLKGAIDRARADGASSLTAIAAHLNAQGITTSQGGQWHPQSVKRVLAML